MLVALAAIIYIFAGKSGGKTTADSADLGLYVARSGEMNGLTISIDDLWDEGFTIELKEKGKAAINCALVAQAIQGGRFKTFSGRLNVKRQPARS